jgi:TetR/AcrR family transcriptional regulator, repressor for uid operon
MPLPRVAQRQSDRRVEILEAAQRCFARNGFHSTSMQQICAEAGMSPGNLYRYFPSKEAIIAGIAERDRAEVMLEFESADLSQGLFATLEGMARHHFAERPDEQIGLCIEITSESRRNSEVARIYRAFDADVRARIVAMLSHAAQRGDIPADTDFGKVTEMLMVIADGVWMRRAIDPNFDANAMIPMFMNVTRHLLRAPADDGNEDRSRQDRTQENAR